MKIMPYTPEQWAAREAQVLVARALLESKYVYPSIKSISLVLDWSETSTGRVTSRLRARAAWPPSPVPRPRPFENTDIPAQLAAVRRGKAGGKVDIEKATAAIRRRWTEAVEIERRARGRRVEARIPGWSGRVPAGGRA